MKKKIVNLMSKHDELLLSDTFYAISIYLDELKVCMQLSKIVLK